MRLILKPHQRSMLRYTFSVQHPALFADPRTGKTLVTVRRCKAYPDCYLYLIAAPYSTVEAWQTTLAAEGFTLNVVTGDQPAQVQASLELAAAVKCDRPVSKLWIFINKELHLRYGNILKVVPWDVVILDESTFIKSPKTKASRFFTKNFRMAAHRWILTGTPAPESELEFFQQLKFLDPNIIGLPDYYKFRYRYFITPRDPHAQHEYYITKDGRARLTRKLAGKVLFVTQADAGMANTKIFQRRIVRLTPEVRGMYDEVERIFIMRLNGQELDRTVYSMEAWIWMRRMCGGWLPQTGVIPCEKLDDLADYLADQHRTSRVIIWSVFLDEIKMIVERLQKEKRRVDFICGARSQSKREEVKARFRSGELDTIVCQPECFRHGVELSAADALIYYTVPAGLETYLQTLERATHMNRKSAVLVVHYATEDTVEVDLLNSLNRKEKRHEQTRSIVRAIAARQAARVSDKPVNSRPRMDNRLGKLARDGYSDMGKHQGETRRQCAVRSGAVTEHVSRVRRIVTTDKTASRYS
jgi:superfamily II DNA or RNA helicase